MPYIIRSSLEKASKLDNACCRKMITAQHFVYAVHAKVLIGEGVAAGVASVRRHQELPTPWPVPADFKLDLPLAKYESIRDASGTSVIVCLRKGKRTLHWDCVTQVRICERKSSMDVKVSEEGEIVPEQRFPCSSCRRPLWLALFSFTHPTENHVEGNIYSAVHGGPCVEQWICPERSCRPWRAHAGSGFWQEL